MHIKTLGAALLIIGTCIGAAMLTLPVATASAGFTHSLSLLIGTWLLMLYTGFLVVEVNLQCAEGSNFFTMAKDKLGKQGQYVVLFVYIALLYSLMSAYEMGGSELVNGILANLSATQLSPWYSNILTLGFFATVIFCGTYMADYLNRGLIIGLFITYSALIATTLPHLHLNYLQGGNSNYLINALPVFFTAYGFHIIIPTLRRYLNSDVKQIKIALVMGATGCLLIYFCWQLAIFGVIPATGDLSLQSILTTGKLNTALLSSLSHHLQNSWITTFATCFTFFALTTSFIGVALSLCDFLTDTLKLSSTRKGRLLAIILAFLPPFIVTWLYPQGFLKTISYAGILVAILHGILPAAMAWQGRRQALVLPYITPGGNMGLLIVVILSLIVIGERL